MKRIKLLIIAVVVAIAACQPSNGSLTETELALVNELRFDTALMSKVRAAGESFERLEVLSEDYEFYPTVGIKLFTKPSKGRKALERLRRILDDTKYSAYLFDENYGYAPDENAGTMPISPWLAQGAITTMSRMRMSSSNTKPGMNNTD